MSFFLAFRVYANVFRCWGSRFGKYRKKVLFEARERFDGCDRVVVHIHLLWVDVSWFIDRIHPENARKSG